MKQYFVTGTDTGVGKTTVSCALLAAARARGLTVDAIKPVETGCPPDEHPADVAALAHATGGDPRPMHVFRAPLAPSVAAEREGDLVDLDFIDAGWQVVRKGRPDLVLVEGAGGLLVPLTDDVDMAGLARRLELPLLVVSRDSLGTINHTLLTLEAAARRGLEVAGVVLSAAAPGTPRREAERNALEIARRGRAPILGIFPHQPDFSLPALAAAAEAHLDLAALLPCK